MKSQLLITKLIFTIILFFSISKISTGQYDPLYSQYMFNIQAYNPAYVGSTNSLSIMALGRQQWVGFEGAPETYTLSVQSPLRNNKIGLGLDLINDHIGMINRLSAQTNYAYKLNIDANNILQLGLKAGCTFYQNNLDNYILNDLNDELIINDLSQAYLINFGFGAYMYGEQYYVGFSIPTLLNNEVGDNLNQFEISNMYLTGGITLSMNENIEFKPSFQARYNYNQIVADLNAGFAFFDRFGIGVIYRAMSDAFGMGATSYVKMTKQITVGYAYDFNNSSSIRAFNSGTHEIMVRFDLSSEKTNYTSPQFF